ncbi:hypothetical protein LBWT_X4540 (plasmid) [Leptolyngbya boryana IAM M-101]|nr:hypothetical protein LBWT_X4540 [Leptolyngbya boryana IAM M-101]BAS66730.1 hypothetical protein LBDG_X4540 [Leptolyngbya boryana dg5]
MLNPTFFAFPSSSSIATTGNYPCDRLFTNLNASTQLSDFS